MNNRCLIVVILHFLLLMAFTQIAKAAPPKSSAPPVFITADPSFQQMYNEYVYPIVIRIHNSGKSTKGVIQVHEDKFAPTRIYSIPVDLPSGADERFFAYPQFPPYSVNGLKVDFIGGEKANSPTLTYEYGRDSEIGCVSDSSGMLTSLEDYVGKHSSRMPSLSGCYAKPEDAPDRAVGYFGLSSLIVGRGAERLSDAQWDAIRRWVMQGGTLILMGGPGSLSYLNLPIPRRLSPFQNMTEAASGPIYCHFKHAIDLSSQPLPQSTVVVGSLKYGASQDPVYGLFDGRKNDLSETRYGSGRVYLIGCDLFSNTVKMRKDYGNLFGGLLYFIGISPPKVDSDDSNSNNSQDMKLFHVTLPSAAVVSVIFLLYFLVAIPGTYLILKKKQRLELAWAAIPIISIVFALSFQVYAINLYKQGLSHFTTGALALANGETDGYFTGQTEIYFPKGGQYDIAVPGAEMLEEKGEDQLRTSILETYDTTAGIAALSYPVTNLSFRNFSYSCPVFLSGPITGRIALENGRLIGTITNKSGWRLAGARLVLAQWSDISAEEVKNPSETLPKKGQEGVRQSSIVLDDILPGETKNLSEALPNKMRSPDEVVLSASIPEEAVGPQIGKSVAQNGGSNISMYIPIIKEGAKK